MRNQDIRGTDLLGSLKSDTTYLQDAHDRRRNEHTPTAPGYKFGTDNPADPIDHQYAVDRDTGEWTWYWNGAWRTAAAGGGGSAMWPTEHRFIEPAEFKANASPFPRNTYYAEIADDSAMWDGYKLQNKNPGSGLYVNGAEVYFAGRLGPKGSYWALTGVFETATDCGKLEFDFATASDDDSVPYLTMPAGAAGSPADTSYIPNWYRQPTTANGNPVLDLYSSSTTKNVCIGIAFFRIVGDDGDPLTANADWATDPDGMTGGFNGGSGLWWIRAKVNGRNASNTTSYRCPISRLSLVRTSFDGWAFA